MATNNFNILPALDMLNQYLSRKATSKVMTDYTRNLSSNIQESTTPEQLANVMQSSINNIYSDDYLDQDSKNQLINVLGQQSNLQQGKIATDMQRKSAEGTLDVLSGMSQGAKFYYGGETLDSNQLKEKVLAEYSDDPVMASKIFENTLKNSVISNDEQVLFDPSGKNTTYMQLARTASGVEVSSQMSPILKETKSNQLYRDTNNNKQMDKGEGLSNKALMSYQTQKVQYDINANEQERNANFQIKKMLLTDKLREERTANKAYQEAIRGTVKRVVDKDGRSTMAIVRLKEGTSMEDYLSGAFDVEFFDATNRSKKLENILGLESEERVADINRRFSSALTELESTYKENNTDFKDHIMENYTPLKNFLNTEEDSEFYENRKTGAFRGMQTRQWEKMAMDYKQFHKENKLEDEDKRMEGAFIDVLGLERFNAIMGNATVEVEPAKDDRGKPKKEAEQTNIESSTSKYMSGGSK